MVMSPVLVGTTRSVCCVRIVRVAGGWWKEAVTPHTTTRKIGVWMQSSSECHGRTNLIERGANLQL